MRKALLNSICFVLFAGVINIFPQVGTQIPIAPGTIPQFVDPLPHFAGSRVDAKAGGNLTIKMVPNDQIALSTGTVVNGGIIGGVIDPLINPSLGKAHLWTYRIFGGNYPNGTPANWPAFTIEAQRGNALHIAYENLLSGETYDKVGLKVDQTLHWADPDMTMMSMDPYTGEPPTVVHLHGGEVPSLSDGGPSSWFTPNNAKKGFFFNPDPFYYPNNQEGATVWYHDHALGATRLNVYAGLAGYYFLRGSDEESKHLPGWSGDNKVQQIDRVSGLPVGAPYLPEIEIAIQDRMFDTDGKLYYPNLPTNPMVHPTWTPEFVGDIITVNGKTWPYLSVAPRKYRFRILNGSNARTYELWLQDLVSKTNGPIIYQIGTDGGLLDAPVAINPALGGKLLLMPGERADVVIDFSGLPGAVWTIRNTAKTPYPAGDTPMGTTTGRIMQFVVNGQLQGADNSLLPGSLRTTPLVKLTNFAGAPAAGITVSKTRQLTLNEVMGMGGPLEILVNNTKWGGKSVDTDLFTNGIRPDFKFVETGMHDTYFSETLEEGKTEVWKIINTTADAHPIHLHLVQFQIMSRQQYNTNKYIKLYNSLFPATTTVLDPMTGLPYPGGAFIGGYGPPKAYDFYYNGGVGWLGGNPDVTPYLQGPVKPALPNERGWKDTFIMYPGEVTTVIIRMAPTDKAVTEPYSNLYFGFDPSKGPGYVWHCHIIDHEDNEMMRPYDVTPNPNNVNVLGKRIAKTEIASVTDFSLGQNYPNPFNPNTVINFSIPKENTLVTLKVYNIIGKEVGTLINQVVPPGSHQVNFDARGLSSGVYFYTLKAGSFVDSKKMILMK